ncbi:MAG: lantibiotic modifying enzyme [Crocinitomix sp.]|jgi:lantibiotic modifying enzyme
MKTTYGLFTGRMAELIAFYELDERNNGNYDRDIDELFDSIMTFFYETSDTSFCSGKSGIIWGLLFLQKKGWLSSEELDFLKDEYEVIFISFKSDIEAGNFDHLYGATGKLKTLIFSENAFLEEAIAIYLDGLKTHIIYTQNEAFLYENFISKKKGKVVNFGLAHGLTSIIITLCEIVKITQSEYALNLLSGLTNYIRSFKKAASLSVYPSHITDGIPDYNSPFGWCYGDLIISVAFFKAWQINQDQSLFIEAKWLAKNSAEKINANQIHYDDNFICHGTTGMALMFFQLYKQFGILSLQSAGQKLVLMQDDSDFKIEGGLLDGKTGIILSKALLSNKINDDWLQPLLLNIKLDL